jgi:hypothetical protein
MTTNERLAVAGLLPRFDGAIESRNREGAIQLLTQVEFTPDQAARIIETVFADPGRYGFAVPPTA